VVQVEVQVEGTTLEVQEVHVEGTTLEVQVEVQVEPTQVLLFLLFSTADFPQQTLGEFSQGPLKVINNGLVMA